MSAVLVKASRSNILEATMPEAVEVAQAFRAARLAGGEDVRGTWVGPSPRITRTAPLGAFHTAVAWVYAWPTAAPWRTGAPMRALSEELRANVLRELGDGWSVEVLTFDPAAHGSLDWWRTGGAAVTNTRDAAPVLTDRLRQPDNPTGPTVPTASGVPWLALGLGAAVVVGLGVAVYSASASRAPLVVVQSGGSRSRR